MKLISNGEMSQVAPRLWQGSRPECGTDLRALGIDVLVLSAMEHQLAASCFQGVETLYVKLDDSGPPPSERELRDAQRVADDVAWRYMHGERVLITCFAGLNRSGLITALVLMRAYGFDGKTAIAVVQAARPAALGNAHFRAYLEGLPPRGPMAFAPRAGVKDPSFMRRAHDFAQSVLSANAR